MAQYETPRPASSASPGTSRFRGLPPVAMITARGEVRLVRRHDSLSFALGGDLEDLAHSDLDVKRARLLLQPCGELAAIDRLEPRIVLDPLAVQELTAAEALVEDQCAQARAPSVESRRESGWPSADDDDIVRRHDLSGSREELLDARSIRLEALDDLAVDHERRRGAALPRVDQLIARPRIGLDVLRFVGDAVLPKELLGGAAVPSARLVIENYTRHHAALLLDFALGLLRSGLGSNGRQGFAPCCPSFIPLLIAAITVTWKASMSTIAGMPNGQSGIPVRE